MITFDGARLRCEDGGWRMAANGDGDVDDDVDVFEAVLMVMLLPPRPSPCRRY